MRSTFATDKAITDVLIDAQTPGALEFDINSNIEINNYDPGDFRHDSVDVDQGVYVYFEETMFETRNGSNKSQGHEPQLHIDIYISKNAQAAAGIVTPSVKVADAELKSVCGQIYDAVMHTTFLRLINDKIKSDTSTGDFRISSCLIFKAKKIGVLRLTESMKTIAGFRYILTPAVTEIPGVNPGKTLTSVDDQITPYTKEPE